MKPFKKPRRKYALLILVVLCLSLFAGYTMAIEEPKYLVTEKSGKLELRTYEPMIIAEVAVDGNMDSASSRGFRLIAEGPRAPAASICGVVAGTIGRAFDGGRMIGRWPEIGG